MEKKTNQCPEIPFFGARYPDGRCIDGFMWDLDKCDENGLIGGGEYPCPFCNSEMVIQEAIDNEEGSREELEQLRDNFWEKHGYTPSN